MNAKMTKSEAVKYLRGRGIEYIETHRRGMLVWKVSEANNKKASVSSVGRYSSAGYYQDAIDEATAYAIETKDF